MRVNYRHDYVPQSDKYISYGVINESWFRRVAGGFSWPSIEYPGYALILSEDIQPDETIQLNPLRIISEFESRDIDEILKWCEMREIDMPREIRLEWYTDTSNRPNMQFVFMRRNDLRTHGLWDTLNFIPAPYIDFKDDERNAFYYQIIRKYMSKEALHFSDNSKLARDLSTLDAKSKPPNPVLALGYVVAAMAAWPNTGRIME